MLIVAIAAVSVVFLLLLLTTLVCVRLMKRMRILVTRLVVLKELMAPKSGTNPEQRLVFGRRYLNETITWSMPRKQARA